MQSSSIGRISASTALGILGIAAALAPGCSFGGASECTVVDNAAPYRGIRDGADLKLDNRSAALRPVLRECGDVVDIQFVPGSSDKAVVIDQAGTARWVDFSAKTSGEWVTVDVTSGGEKGLLGLAFHPKFTDNGRFFLNWTVKDNGKLITRVGAFQADKAAPFGSTPTQQHVVYEVDQPYGNHNAGGLGFGPDGMLYVGFGDGGAANDPHGNGQDRSTALGSMVRLDVDSKTPYAVPTDNPFRGTEGVLPEIWAYGLRNPWGYSWDDDGRMVVADVGQNAWEELTFLEKGANAGWNTVEGTHCFKPKNGCSKEGLLAPIWDYPHSEGQSITGGYQAKAPENLAGRFLFGDYVSGRIWAVSLPDTVGERATDVAAVGRFPVRISTFGRDAAGTIYVGGHTDGTVYRLVAD